MRGCWPLSTRSSYRLDSSTGRRTLGCTICVPDPALADQHAALDQVVDRAAHGGPRHTQPFRRDRLRSAAGCPRAARRSRSAAASASRPGNTAEPGCSGRARRRALGPVPPLRHRPIPRCFVRMSGQSIDVSWLTRVHLSRWSGSLPIRRGHRREDSDAAAGSAGRADDRGAGRVRGAHHGPAGRRHLSAADRRLAAARRELRQVPRRQRGERRGGRGPARPAHRADQPHRRRTRSASSCTTRCAASASTTGSSPRSPSTRPR